MADHLNAYKASAITVDTGGGTTATLQAVLDAGGAAGTGDGLMTDSPAAMADLTGGQSPTEGEFNALLALLRTRGVLAP